MEKIIKEKISSLLSEEEEVLSVEQLGGMTNQNYLAKTTNKQYIVKFFGKGTEKLINRQDEKYNLELLKDLDLDVKNYLFDIEAGIKVNEYIESVRLRLIQRQSRPNLIKLLQYYKLFMLLARN